MEKRVIVVGAGTTAQAIRDLLHQHPDFVVVIAPDEKSAAETQGAVVTWQTIRFPDSLMREVAAHFYATADVPPKLARPRKIAPYGKKAKRGQPW